MQAKLFSTLIMTFLICQHSRAENSLAAAAIVQMQMQSFCGQVSENDVKSAGFSCRPEDRLRSMSLTSAQFFEWNVFQVAAKSQVQKNKCLQEQIDGLLSDGELKKIWYEQLKSAWLGQRKAHLILDTCSREFFSRLEPANVKRFGYRAAYQKSLAHDTFGTRKALAPKWVDICSDEKQVDALKVATKMFAYSLPIVSDASLFNEVEAHRQMIINAKTGKPVTNEEILNADLHDTKSLSFREDKAFEAVVNKNIAKLGKDRNEITTQILRSQHGGQYQLSSAVKDFIYDDNTLFETLESQNLMGKPPSADGKPGPMPAGTSCLLSKYQVGNVSEIGSLAIESLFIGGLFSRALRVASEAEAIVNGLKNAQKTNLIEDFNQGLTIRTYLMINDQVNKSCPDPNFGDKTYLKKTMLNASDIKDAPAKAANLPGDFDYKPWELAMSPQKAPSCQGAQKKFLLNSVYKAHCLIDSLLAAAPLEISLPAMFVTDN